MKNTILKPGDMVKYRVETPYLNQIGFKLGQIYHVIGYPDGGLLIKASIPAFDLPLVLPEGTFTDYADHFAVHRCPVTLPRGL